MRRNVSYFICLALFAVAPAAQAIQVKLTVQVVGKEFHNTPCVRNPGAGRGGVNCPSPEAGEYERTPLECEGEQSYIVRGATLSLLLPDKRTVVVTCDRKRKWLMHPGDWRDCRVPSTNTVQVTLDDKNAKLEWPVSPDGEKKTNETYSIVAAPTKAPNQ